MVLTRVVPDPASYVAGVTMPTEVLLTIGWNVVSHVELEPAHCGDENCEADHGYTGTITADDLALRVSEAADGEEGRPRRSCPSPARSPRPPSGREAAGHDALGVTLPA